MIAPHYLTLYDTKLSIPYFQGKFIFEKFKHVCLTLPIIRAL